MASDQGVFQPHKVQLSTDSTYEVVTALWSLWVRSEIARTSANNLRPGHDDSQVCELCNGLWRQLLRPGTVAVMRRCAKRDGVRC
jgi:hypothetical protein